MPLKSIYSFLVHPAKHAEGKIRIAGAKIPLSGRLHDMLADVYQKSDTECNIDISFNPSQDGKQQNDCRDDIVRYLQSPNTTNGRRLAERLQSVTNKISGLGLFFLMLGERDGETKLVLSRFPADKAILAEQQKGSLSVQFLEKVFMKSATTYKAVVYKDRSVTGGFWAGKAIDKQIGSNDLTISNYWIKDFLLSDFRTTSAAGTRRLAIAIRDAVNQTDNLSIKEELAAASRLAPSLAGKATSIEGFARRFALSTDTQAAVRRELRNERLYAEQFTFDGQEFSKHISYKSVELSNGGILTADANKFDDVFTAEEVNKSNHEMEYTTRGTVVDQRLKSKP